MNLKVLFVEDDEQRRTNLIEYFDQEEIAGHTISASGAETFEKGIEAVSQTDYDIVVLDLYKGQPSENNEKLGLEVLQQIQSTAFIPVVFYSGLTKDIIDLKSEIVGVVNKGEGGIEELRAELERIISSNLALIKQQINKHIKESLRQYFWETVHSQNNIFAPGKLDVSLGYLLLRRIASSLSKENIKTLLGDEMVKADKTHPMEFYIYPAATGEYEAGEILLKDGVFYVILTPSCDFVCSAGRERKAEKVLLSIATPLKSTEFYKKYEANKEKYKQSLANVIESRKGDRYFFLPGTPFIDNLLLDFQNKSLIPYEELKNFTRVAKLDDPFAQSMISSFIRYYNRIGFPDIDADYVIENL